MKFQQSLHVHVLVQPSLPGLLCNYLFLILFARGRSYIQTKIILWIISKTRKPVVTGKKVIVFLSIFRRQFLSHQKILSVTTKDTAELNVKHVKHNVITTKPIKMTFQQSLHVHVLVQPSLPWLLCNFLFSTLFARGRSCRQNNSLNYK